MRLSHLLTMLCATTLAGIAIWQEELHRREAIAEAVLREVRAVCPANLVRFPKSGNLLLETGPAWAEQPAEWRGRMLQSLQAAHRAGHIWQIDSAPYRDADGNLMPADH